MYGDLGVLLTSTSEELAGERDEELERWLAWLRCWRGVCRLRFGRRIVLEDRVRRP